MGGLSGQFAETQREPALVAGGGVLLDDAPLGGAVNQGVSLGNQLRGCLDVFGREQTAHGTDAMAQAGLASPVYGRPPFRDAHAFECRYSICHSNLKDSKWGGCGQMLYAGFASVIRITGQALSLSSGNCVVASFGPAGKLRAFLPGAVPLAISFSSTPSISRSITSFSKGVPPASCDPSQPRRILSA